MRYASTTILGKRRASGVRDRRKRAAADGRDRGTGRDDRPALPRPDLLSWTGDRSFRRRAFRQPRQRRRYAADPAGGRGAGQLLLALFHGQRRAAGLAQFGDGAADRAARARRGRADDRDMGRPCQRADPDAGAQHPDRPGVGGKGGAARHGSASGRRARDRVRCAAEDRPRAGQPRPLRPSRQGDAQTPVAARSAADRHEPRERQRDRPDRRDGDRARLGGRAWRSSLVSRSA